MLVHFHFNEIAFKCLDAHSLVSLFVFTNQILNKNSIIDLPILTGGFLRFLSFDINVQDYVSLFKSLFNPYLYHDTIFLINGPDNTTISDYTGPGYLKSSKIIQVSKMREKVSLFFDFQLRNSHRNVFQFFVVYTSGSGGRFARINSFQLPPYSNFLNIYVSTRFLLGMTCNRYLLENHEKALHYLHQMKKTISKMIEFNESCYRPIQLIENFINNQNLMETVEKSLIYRDGIDISNFLPNETPNQNIISNLMI